jgi:hypothetical protein
MAKKAIVSPAGIAIHPRVNTPDTKFDDAGVFKVALAYDPKLSSTKKFLKDIDAAHAAAVAEAKKNGNGKKGKINPVPYETNEDTGMVEVKFKATASFVDKKTDEVVHKKIALFDAAGQPFDRDTIIGGGSKLKASFILRNYETPSAGVKLNLIAVQVLDLVEYSGGTAAGYGFSNEEEDEDGDDVPGSAEGDAEAEGEDDDGDGEF